MSEDNKKHIPIEDGAEDVKEEAAAETAEETKEEPSTEEAAADEKAEAAADEAQTEDVKEEAEENTASAEEQESERYMRLMAEFQNYKRRAAKEKSDIHQYANEKIVGELLPVLDNFERAISTEGGDLEAYAKGMELIFEQLKTALGNAGLTEIEAMDKVFDPNVHNAVMTETVEDKEEGTITKVLQKGYKLKDKVVRPSMVAVNKK